MCINCIYKCIIMVLQSQGKKDIYLLMYLWLETLQYFSLFQILPIVRCQHVIESSKNARKCISFLSEKNKWTKNTNGFFLPFQKTLPHFKEHCIKRACIVFGIGAYFQLNSEVKVRTSVRTKDSKCWLNFFF